jgi:hypothetical protein
MRLDQLSAHRREQARRRLGLPAGASEATIRAALRAQIDATGIQDLGLAASAPLAAIQAAVRARGTDGRFEPRDGASPALESHEAYMARAFPALARKGAATPAKAPVRAKTAERPRADLTARHGAGQRDFSW